jgi:hypothetical protein
LDHFKVKICEYYKDFHAWKVGSGLGAGAALKSGTLFPDPLAKSSGSDTGFSSIFNFFLPRQHRTEGNFKYVFPEWIGQFFLWIFFLIVSIRQNDRRDRIRRPGSQKVTGDPDNVHKYFIVWHFITVVQFIFETLSHLFYLLDVFSDYIFRPDLDKKMAWMWTEDE